ncbi:MAG TPA: ribonuclease P protein component [Mycobacteriales bacterium]|nr:ribonuclease P protein component [Mycobacteriales bacterium]
MLPAAARLRHRESFSAVLRRGRRVTRGPLVFHFGTTSTDPAHTARGESVRVGFVISGKVGNAVRRNALRRRLRHLLRSRLDSLPAADLVVRALPGAAELTYSELDRLLDAGLQAQESR